MDPESEEHEFAMVLTGIDELTAEAMDALFAAGCDDATLSVRSGAVYATFARVAPSLEDAIFSAIRDVERAAIGVKEVRCIGIGDQKKRIVGLPDTDLGTRQESRDDRIP